MKVYIAVDANNIVRCLASERCNIHKDKDHFPIYHVEKKGTVGDEYAAKTNEWIPRPENYAKPSQDQINNLKIAQEMRKISIKSLKNKGELPPDYEE